MTKILIFFFILKYFIFIFSLVNTIKANREAKIIQNKKNHLSSLENITEIEKEKIKKAIKRKLMSLISLINQV